MCGNHRGDRKIGGSYQESENTDTQKYPKTQNWKTILYKQKTSKVLKNAHTKQ